MRGALGGTEVAAVVAVTPQGVVTPLAILTTAEEIAEEIHLAPAAESGHAADGHAADGHAADGLLPARVGDYDVQVVVRAGADGRPRPLAVLTTPWIDQHLLLFARTLWRRR